MMRRVEISLRPHSYGSKSNDIEEVLLIALAMGKHIHTVPSGHVICDSDHSEPQD